MTKQQKFCPNCGNQLLGDEKFCGKCGFDVSKVTQENNINKQEKNIQDVSSNTGEHQDNSAESSNLTQEHKDRRQEVDNTQRQGRSTDRKEKRISKIVWSIGLLIALIGVGAWGVYTYNQKSQTVASSKPAKHHNKKAESKSNQKSSKKNHEKNKVYPVKISSISVGTNTTHSRFNNGMWVLKGKTDAPDGSMILGYIPKTSKRFNDDTKLNVALDNTHYFKNGESTDEMLGRVKNGKFNIQIDTSIINGALKAGARGEVVIVALENPQINTNDNISTNLFNKITNGGTKLTLEMNDYQAKVANRKEPAEDANSDSSVDGNGEENSSDDSDEDSSIAESSSNENVVNSPQEAIAYAKARYGDNNGDWDWTYLSSDDSDPEVDGYFVKAISKSSNTMTGTAKSVIVYPDGTIDEN